MLLRPEGEQVDCISKNGCDNGFNPRFSSRSWPHLDARETGNVVCMSDSHESVRESKVPLQRRKRRTNTGRY